ncbi:phage holin family protein [Streptomyces sp. TLI_185]|uniref:phage holin family protein n=1 Tax=Streptomyces sp. TLI_185 TaxID=2485151 RepID=UPI000F4E7FA4|nr:phage holin family protein [Streptomyces sp. TLI_185]RPF37526.1 putative superfamily III holin-X [Streptomyces sp. TLI_185]
MEGLDHLEHLDRHLVDELAQVARETVRDELREQTRKQRRRAMLYAVSGAVALYAGAALALTLGLALAIGLPDWAAALITGAVLGVIAYVLRGMARPATSRPTSEREAELAASQGDPVVGGRAPAAPPSGLGAPYPPMPPVAPGGLGGAAGAPVAGEPGGAGTPAPSQDDIDPEQPHHRA